MNKKSVALFDFDKTIYKDHSIFTVTKHLINKGFVEAGTDVRMIEEFGKYKLGVRGYIETAEQVLKIHAKAMDGLDCSVIKEETVEFLEANMDRFYPYFQRILPKLKATHDVFLITASPQNIAEAVEKMFSLDGFLSTEYEVIDERFTGMVKNSLAGSKEVVEEIVKRYGGQTLAFGDSDSDIEMLERVKLPICINPNEVLLTHALENKWLVVNEDNIEKKLGEALGW